MTDEITQSVETASSDTSPASGERATSTWAKGLLPYGARGGPDSTDSSMLLMCFKRDWSDSEPTETPQPFLVQYGPGSLLVAQASQVIHTSGAPLLLSLHSSAWRLQIATTNALLPGHWGIEFSGFEAPATLIVMQAKLYVLPPASQDVSGNFSASNVWRAVVTTDNDVETLSFLHTVLQQAELRT